MNIFNMAKPLHVSIVFIIMKAFILEGNSVSVSTVVKPLCYGVL